MRHIPRALLTVMMLSGLVLVCSGCEREIAHTEETTIKDDGTVKTKEKTVTEDGDGITVTETESTKKPD